MVVHHYKTFLIFPECSEKRSRFRKWSINMQISHIVSEDRETNRTLCRNFSNFDDLLEIIKSTAQEQKKSRAIIKFSIQSTNSTKIVDENNSKSKFYTKLGYSTTVFLFDSEIAKNRVLIYSLAENLHSRSACPEKLFYAS